MASNFKEKKKLSFLFKVIECPQTLSQNVSIPSGRSRTLVFTGNNLEVPESVRC